MEPAGHRVPSARNDPVTDAQGEPFRRRAVLDKTGNLKAVQKLLDDESIQTAGDIYTDWDIAQLADTLLEVVRIEPHANHSPRRVGFPLLIPF